MNTKLMMADVWEEFTSEEREDVLKLVSNFTLIYKNMHMGLLPFVSFSEMLSMVVNFDLNGVEYWNRENPDQKSFLTGAIPIIRVATKLGLNKRAPVLETSQQRKVNV